MENAISMASGYFCRHLGHGHPRAVRGRSQATGYHDLRSSLHSVADVTLDFIEKLGGVAPENLTFVKPYSGGSESIESALKFTRQNFGRQAGLANTNSSVATWHIMEPPSAQWLRAEPALAKAHSNRT